MLNRRDSYSRNFISVTATVLLLFGCSSYIFAEDTSGKTDSLSPAQSAGSPTSTSTVTLVSPTSKSASTQPVTGPTQTEANATQPVTGGTQPVTNGTQEVTNGTQSVTNGTQPVMNGTQTVTNGTQPVTHGTSSVTNSSQSDSTNQTAGRGAHDSHSEPLSSLSIFLVSDLQYDIFPVYSEDANLCNVDQQDKCVGGLPSLKSYMDEKQSNDSHSIFLNAGNTLGGNYFRTLKFKTAVQAMQLLNFSATTVGSNVFKYGGEAGQIYLDGLEETVVVSNIDPAPKHKSITFRVGNCNVTVIGYLESSEQDIHGVSVKNYTESIIEEVNRIRKDQQNVSQLITVVIGSSTVNKSKALASNDVIDFVFFSGANWSEEAAQSKGGQNVSTWFWDMVNKTSVNKTAYVGSLKVNHSSETGRFIIGHMLLPLTDSCGVANASFSVEDYTNFTQNKAALDLIKTELTRLQSQNESLTVNTKNLTAERDMCSHSECSLGNLITDAMVAALRSNSTWTSNASRIGIFPAVHLEPNGTIPEGNVTAMNLYELTAQDAYIYSVLLTGHQLKNMLEIAINSMNNSNSSDFLHVSGLLQIEYRKELENNSRIASIKTVSAASSSMLLSKIDVNDNATFYNVSVPLTLLKMENYRKLLGAVNASFHPVTIVEALSSYINNTGVLLLPAVGTRLILLESFPALPIPPPASCENHTGVIIIVTLAVTALVIGLVYGIWRWRSIRSHLIPGYINF